MVKKPTVMVVVVIVAVSASRPGCQRKLVTAFVQDSLSNQSSRSTQPSHPFRGRRSEYKTQLYEERHMLRIRLAAAYYGHRRTQGTTGVFLTPPPMAA